jgi:serine/threonine-protein kinase SRPK3
MKQERDRLWKTKALICSTGNRENKDGIVMSSVLDFTAGDQDVNAYENIVVKIADLGNACWMKDECNHLIQTREYRSPEVILGANWTEKADLWSLACMVSAIKG